MAQVHLLRFISGKYEREEFALGPATSHIAGRSSEADLVLADDAVSRKHARFYTSRGRTWVRDLGSRNGTIVNGKPVDVACLREGDRLAIGSSLMKVFLVEASQATATIRAGERRRARGEDNMTGRSMSGSIEDIPLVDVLQWLSQSRRTGTLKVRGGDHGQAGALQLREGRVFYASIDGRAKLHPEKALRRMLGWGEGMFELDTNEMDDVPVEIDVSLEHMLMETARQQDELAVLASKTTLPGPGTLVRPVKPSPLRWTELDSEELSLLQDLIEQGDWFELLDDSEIDDLTLTRTLVGLVEKGVVELA